MQETQVQSLSRDDPMEKEMATHSNILALRIKWTEEPDGLHSMGLQESDTTEQLTHTDTHPVIQYHLLKRPFFLSLHCSIWISDLICTDRLLESIFCSMVSLSKLLTFSYCTHYCSNLSLDFWYYEVSNFIYLSLFVIVGCPRPTYFHITLKITSLRPYKTNTRRLTELME